jgi:hypothetical protein
MSVTLLHSPGTPMLGSSGSLRNQFHFNSVWDAATSALLLTTVSEWRLPAALPRLAGHASSKGDGQSSPRAKRATKRAPTFANAHHAATSPANFLNCGQPRLFSGTVSPQLWARRA